MRAYILDVGKKLAAQDRSRAVGYVRVSTTRQVEEGGSLAAQREAIIRHAVLSGYELADVYEDAGISGGKGDDERPGLAAALDALLTGQATVLVVTHADRLARDSDLSGYLRTRVKKAGARLDVIAEAKNDPIRIAVDKMLAELERYRGSERMRSWNAARKAKGLHSGPPPFGYRCDHEGRLEPNPSERPTLDRIRELRAAGRPLRAIAAALTEEGRPTRSGAKWSAQLVHVILRRLTDQPHEGS